MKSKPLLIAALAAAVLGCAPSMIVDEESDFIVTRIAVATSDLSMPADAPILYRRLRIAAARGCYTPHSAIEYMFGPARADEARCRKQALDDAVAALGDPTILALHMQTQTPRAHAAR